MTSVNIEHFSAEIQTKYIPDASLGPKRYPCHIATEALQWLSVSILKLGTR
jgi:hypothetical protein